MKRAYTKFSLQRYAERLFVKVFFPL